MKRALAGILITCAVLALFGLWAKSLKDNGGPENGMGAEALLREIKERIKPGESLYAIFMRHGVPTVEIELMREAALGVYRLGRMMAGRPYSICINDCNQVVSFTYEIDDDSYISLQREGEGFIARKVSYEYETRIAHIGGVIKENLFNDLGDPFLTYALSDIFAWQVDFTDLKPGDAFKVVVEELYLNGQFRKYGRILSALFETEGATYNAYWFERDGQGEYYDGEGNTMRRAFLKAPLSFRRISSGFTKKRLHPILKIYRPHLGVDYAAPAGTPVSAPADGVVEFAGRKGANGNLIILRHPNGYKTYYGHLLRFAKGTGRGRKVAQGDVIGFVGSTGRSTGPHLDYRIKKGGRNINPLALKSQPSRKLDGKFRREFEALITNMDKRLASIDVNGSET